MAMFHFTENVSANNEDAVDFLFFAPKINWLP